MCEPISATIGVLSAVGGGMQAIGAHQQQQAAVARSNAIAQQQYQRDLQIASVRDQEAGRAYIAKQEANTAAKNAYFAQLSAYQTEANRALDAVNQKRKEKGTSAAFGAQAAITKSIQQQGATLATGKAGQSFLLQAMQAERTMGFELAQVEQSLYDASLASNVERSGILLDQHAANTAAWNGLPADPLSPQASFLPVKPIKAQGPSGLALAGNLVSSAVGGVSSGLGAYSGLKDAGVVG